MVEGLYRIFQPFATMLFYRHYVKNDVADELQKKYPGLNRDEAMARAEYEIRHDNVPALDPLGSFRGADPRRIVRWILALALMSVFGVPALLRISISLSDPDRFVSIRGLFELGLVIFGVFVLLKRRK